MSEDRNPDPTPFPANELEADLIKGRDADDTAYVLRAFAHNVVCHATNVPGPPRGRPAFRTTGNDEIPLPIAEGRDGRTYLLVFTSSWTLFHYYSDPEQVWLQTPAGQLTTRTAGSGWPWLVNAGGPVSLVLEPGDVAKIEAIFAGRSVPEAVGAGGAATRVTLSAPRPEVMELGPVVAPLLAGSGAHRVIAAIGRFAEPRSPSWLRLAVDWPGSDASQVRSVMPRLVETIERATSSPLQLTLLTADEIGQWMAAHGTVIWQRDT